MKQLILLNLWGTLSLSLSSSLEKEKNPQEGKKFFLAPSNSLSLHLFLIYNCCLCFFSPPPQLVDQNIGIIFSLMININIKQSNLCATTTYGTQTEAVVERWSLFRGHLCYKSSKCNLKIVAYNRRWSLFEGSFAQVWVYL